MIVTFALGADCGRRVRDQRSLFMTVVLGLTLLFCVGCGNKGSITAKVVEGEVRCEGKAVEEGMVRFVPAEGTRGPMSSAPIKHGKYRVEERGGVAPGEHRVEVDAWAVSTRKVATRGRFEPVSEQARERLGPEMFSDERSPLHFDVATGTDRFDIDLPAK